MSIFASSDTWPEVEKACGAPHQSPVNLSRSFALPCDRLCDLVLDKVAVPQASASIDSTKGLVLTYGTVHPTARFNGEGYTANTSVLYIPAQHTVENIRAEAEFVTYFTNPKGYTLAVSVPVRTAPGDSPSTSFFSRFVPYPTTPDQPTPVTLGSDWMLQDIVPEGKGFFVYEGSDVVPPCTPSVTWIVFSNSVTMDPSEFARLTSQVPPGNRPLQQVGDREVFYNDGEKIDSSMSKKDGKVYMRCRRIPNKAEVPESGTAVKQSQLGAKAAEAASATRNIVANNLMTWFVDLWIAVGGIWGILFTVLVVLLSWTVYSNATVKNWVNSLFSVV